MSNSPKILARAIHVALATALFSQAALAAPNMLRLEAGPVDETVIVAKNDGNAIYIDSREQNTRVQIRDAKWSEFTYLPNTAPLGATVTVERRSTWKTTVISPDGESFIVAPDSDMTFVWDGTRWEHTISKTNGVSTLNNQGMYEFFLSGTEPTATTTQNVTLHDVQDYTSTAAVVTLSDIRFENGQLINNTPYAISELHAERDGTVLHLDLQSALPAYSQARIDGEWEGTTVLNMSQLSNNSINFAPSIDDKPFDRLATAEERAAVEQVQGLSAFLVECTTNFDRDD